MGKRVPIWKGDGRRVVIAKLDDPAWWLADDEPTPDDDDAAYTEHRLAVAKGDPGYDVGRPGDAYAIAKRRAELATGKPATPEAVMAEFRADPQLYQQHRLQYSRQD